MGQGQSDSLTQEQIDELKANTRFTQKEILAWYEKFKKDFPEGIITKQAFVSLYSQMFPKGDAREFALHIFRAYDVDGNGVIDFAEFIQTLHIAVKVGKMDEKLKWAFKMYDLDGNGYVSRDEAVEMITSIYKMRGYRNEAREEAGKLAVSIFAQLDKDEDDNLSEIEFIQAAKGSPTIRDLLQGGQ